MYTFFKIFEASHLSLKVSTGIENFIHYKNLNLPNLIFSTVITYNPILRGEMALGFKKRGNSYINFFRYFKHILYFIFQLFFIFLSILSSQQRLFGSWTNKIYISMFKVLERGLCTLYKLFFLSFVFLYSYSERGDGSECFTMLIVSHSTK